MKLATLLILSSTLTFGQTTTIPPDAIRPGAVIGVLVCIPGNSTTEGKCTQAILDPSIVLDTSVTPPVLRATSAVKIPQWKTLSYPLTATQQTFLIPDAGFIPATLAVYRNGSLMTQEKDYLIGGTGLSIIFVPRQTPVATDIVVLKYAWQ